MTWPSSTFSVVLSFSLLLAGCQSKTKAPSSRDSIDRSPGENAQTATWERVQRSRPLLGTFVTLTLYGSSQGELHSAANQVFEEFDRVDRLISIHRPDSELALLNQTAAQNPITVSDELLAILKTSLRIADQTHGAFDPTIGPLADLWGFIWKEHRLPNTNELASVLPLVNYRNVRVSSNQVSFAKPGMFLDLGGVGKGYAVDRGIALLQKLGVRNALLKAGGDLRVIGRPPGQNAWTIQVEDPRKQGERAELKLQEGALSTSGNYENFFVVNGIRYSHILDPRTGLPVQGVASCTVIAPTCTESDALATAFFVMPPAQVLESFSGKYSIRYVLISNGSLQVKTSENFPGE